MLCTIAGWFDQHDVAWSAEEAAWSSERTSDVHT